MGSYIDRCDNFTLFKVIQPASENLPVSKKDYIRNRFLGDYKNFFNAQTTSEHVEEVRSRASLLENLVVGRFSESPFFIRDSDIGIGGAEGNSFALVKPGRPEGDLKIVVSHTDTPCLKISSQPVYTEPDAEKCILSQGFSLSAEKYGAVRTEDWLGSNVLIKGNIYLGDRIKKINMPGLIRHRSFHVDPEEKEESRYLRVFMGAKTLKEVYKMFGVKDSLDFGRADLSVVPYNPNNGWVVGDEISGFGHDDHAGGYASLCAFEEIVKKSQDSKNTLIFLGLDREEVGSIGPTCSYENFLREVVSETSNIIFKNKSHSPKRTQSWLKDSPVLFVDTDVGFGDAELDSENNLDFRKAPKIGWGPCINSSDHHWGRAFTSKRQIGEFMKRLDENLPYKSPRKRYQVVAGFVREESPFASGTMGDVFGNRFSVMDLSLPVNALHHPRAESLNIFDLYWLKEAIKVYCKD